MASRDRGRRCLALALAPAPAAAKPALTGCDAFIEKLRLAASDMQVAFTHSLVVSRAKTEVNVFDIATNADVDAHPDLPRRRVPRASRPGSSSRPLRARPTDFDRFAEAALRAGDGLGRG